MPEAVLDEELAEGLSAAKKMPRNFALIVKGEKPVKLLVRKKKFRDAELMKVKTEAKGNDIIVGVLEASGSDFAFKVLGNKEPGANLLKLKDLISEQADMTAKPRWDLVKELPDIGDEDEQREAQQDTTTPQAPPSTDDRAKQLADRLKALAPQIQQALTAQPDRKDELLTAVGNVKTPLGANQLDKAAEAFVPLVNLLKTLLGPSGQQEGAEDADEEELNDLFAEDEGQVSDEETTPSQGQISTLTPEPSEEQLKAQAPPLSPAAKSPVISGRAAWEEARQTVAENLAELQKHLAGTNDPDLQTIARHGFQGITGRLQVGLRVALLEFDTGTGEVREKARKKALEVVGQFQEFVANDKLLKLCDANLFKIPINGQTILGEALTKLAASLKA